MATSRRRAGILISGRGSNMATLVAAMADPAYPASAAVVVSNRPDAAGLALARSKGVPAIAVDHKAYPDKAAFETAVTAVLDEHGVEIVALAGFMRILSTTFIDRWIGRLINIHPSLLPAYRGLDTHARAIADGARVAGCSVHFVVPELDAGPVIAQAVVPVLPGDDTDSLSARVLRAEHRLYPHGLALAASGRVRLDGGAAVFEGIDFDDAASLVTPPPVSA